MSLERVILLRGRRDQPTDGVADYCDHLGEVGAAHGLSFEHAEVAWDKKGWSAAIADLRKQAAGWRGCWVLLQFTTLAWSRRGFPLRAPRILDLLKRSGASPGVVFHDFAPLRGQGIAGNVREYCHLRVLRQLYARSDLSIFTVPLNKISWLPPRRENAVFIPVGSNFPLPSGAPNNDGTPPDRFRVAIFGITGGPQGAKEVADIAHALKFAQPKGGRVRLLALGRGSEVFDRSLRQALEGSGIEVEMLGLLPAQELVDALAGADVLLCVRGQVSTRRGSAIAGIMCGLPVVGYRGEETGFPITEAGVKLVAQGDREGLAQGLAQVLADPNLRRDLRERSLKAARRYFSWDAIATQFASAILGEHPVAGSSAPLDIQIA